MVVGGEPPPPNVRDFVKCASGVCTRALVVSRSVSMHFRRQCQKGKLTINYSAVVPFKLEYNYQAKVELYRVSISTGKLCFERLESEESGSIKRTFCQNRRVGEII